MRFAKATDAIYFWWTVLQAGGVPIADAIYEEDDGYTRVQTTRRAWTPSNLLCIYHDVGIALSRLSPDDQKVVQSYLLDVVGCPEYPKTTTYNYWQYRGRWPHVLKRLWFLLPKEYKHYDTKGRGKGVDSQRDSVLSKRTRRNRLQVATQWQTQGIQGRLPVASLV